MADVAIEILVGIIEAFAAGRGALRTILIWIIVLSAIMLAIGFVFTPGADVPPAPSRS